ncbi:cytoskeleton protein RodZ [Vibrio hippocampi]|uniref:Cytoskeleton protein RodZ n=1 Tax=Vibrio hippocampi TaxID=654686 RepID=A0ABM8ZEQ3_9VIBR|nr:cytoskeleton protein RodZ [Vibrio hippocampi]CAH0524874.1 Cytoskeleton protein RodZ [Vibrio hippocampi]
MSTDQNTQIDNNDSETEFVPAGVLLKQKREALGLTQKQIADRLRLRVAIIQKIEEDEFDGEQVATFTRGYLRSYAKAVGVDETLVLGAISPDEASSQVHEQPMQSFSKKTNKEKHDSRIMKLTWGILVVIIGISSVWWFQNQQKDTLSEIAVNPDSDIPSEPSIEPLNPVQVNTLQVEPSSNDALSQPQPPTGQEPTALSTQDATAPQAPSVIEVPQGTEEAATTADIQPEPVAVTEVVDETPVPEGMTKITMTFTGDCWIQVKDANGKTVVTGIKKTGENVDINGKAPFKVILGAPEQVSMTFASEPVDLSGYTSGKVARFTLP